MIPLRDIANLLNADVIGQDMMVTGINPFEIAEKGDITFAMKDDSVHGAALSEASCVAMVRIVDDYPKTILKVKDMKEAMTVIYNILLESAPSTRSSVHPSASVDATAEIEPGVEIGANVVIGKKSIVKRNTVIGANCVIGRNVLIGENNRLHPNVTLYANTRTGKRVTIHSGSVIGSDGFGYFPKDGRLYKVPQMGMVIIEDDVEIGANSCVDRGTFADTVIGTGTKIDNLVQIAHNVRIGRNVLVAGQSGIAGSSTIADNTMMGGMAGVSDHVNVGNNVKIGAKTGVTKNMPDNMTCFGYPAREARAARKLHALESILLKNSRKFRSLMKDLSEETEKTVE